MDERQTVENIMETLGLNDKLQWLEVASKVSDISMLTILSVAVETAIDYELRRSDELSKERKERSKEKKENIYILNNKENKNNTDLSLLNTRARSSIPPLEAKRQAKEKSSKVDRRVKMPKAWVEAREKETILPDVGIITYAEGQGYDWYSAKELFLAFVDYHLAKGSIFKSWPAAFRTWIRNDIKYNGKPTTKKPGSVVQSYKPKNQIGELFNDGSKHFTT